jgi:hypothetical protein
MDHMSKRNRNQHRNLTVAAGTAPATKTETPSEPSDSPVQPGEMPLDGMSESSYLQERTSLVEIEQKSADQHDKAILAVATGGLALSITFLKDIAPHPQPETWKFLGLSWGFFVLGILTILSSFLTSQSACRKQRDYLDQHYLEGPAAVAGKKNWWSFVTHWLNVASYVFVFFAVVFLTVFTWVNLGKGGQNPMDDKTHDQQISPGSEPRQVKAGYVPPKPPVSPTMQQKPASTEKGNKDNKK